MPGSLKGLKKDSQCCISYSTGFNKSEKRLGSFNFHKRKLRLEHGEKLFTSEPEKFSKSVNQVMERNCCTSKRDGLNARKYRELVKSRMKNVIMSDPMLGKKYKVLEGGANATRDNASKGVEQDMVMNCISHAKRRRKYLGSEDLHFIHNTRLSHNLLGISPPKVVHDQASITSNAPDTENVASEMNVETLVAEDDERNSNSMYSMEFTKEYIDDARVDPHMKGEKDGGAVVCYNCLQLDGGMLLCCHGKGCQRKYHLSCLDPPLNHVPPGFWHCIWCSKKKIECGVHSISEGVESIWDAREVILDNKVMQRQYRVKYQGLAHAHNRWIPETQLLLDAPRVLAKFNRKVQVIRWKSDWTVPHRLLMKRAILLSNQYDEHGHGDNDSHCRYEWLVKWTGLGYDHVTWELDDASFMKSPEGMKLVRDYQNHRKRAEGLSNPSEAHKKEKASFVELSELSSADLPGLYNQHWSYVNKLRMCWHKGQSALIVDDQVDQDRVMKVILFILSLYSYVERPFLIISTSAAISVWEAEFLHLAPSANLVVYKGNKDLRSSIRALEFHNDNGGTLFQILLSSSDIIIEDLDALKCITWEAIIVDQCQRSSILRQFDNIKMLAAEMRFLLVSGQIKEDPADYLKLLSLLNSEFHGLNSVQMGTKNPASISLLKSQLAQFVAFKCNTGSSRFIEYWVPAQLSNLQLEQYCSLLLSNSMFLCSGQKTHPVDAFHDLIVSLRKCCDHPYLLDQSLQSFITKGLPVEDYLNIEIKASGKLQLLEKILLEARSRGLRVTILFQSTGGSGSIGDILDDFVCQRFNKDCYVRYGRGYSRSKKQAALDMFNDRESGKFVFLIEIRACLPSIKLSSVDTVILFDSDWDPQNDLRALQRMSISSQFEQLKVFRLYSSFTIEEKVLILAKEGITLDSSMQWMNLSTCHSLLKWGASYLFNKLDDLHGCGARVSASDISPDQSLLSDVIRELSTQLSCAGDTDCHHMTFVSKVEQNGRVYAGNILLRGEKVLKKLANGPPAFFWSNILEGRHPQWKFLSVSSERIRKKVNYSDQVPKESEFENDVMIRKRRKVSKNIVDPIYLKLKLNNKKKRSAVKKTGRVKDDSSKVLDSTATCPLTSKITRSPTTHLKSVELNKELDMPQATEFSPKPDISGLCDVLQLSKNIKTVAMRILGHVLKHYNVNCQEASTMQAFEISLCWLAASLLKHKIDRKESLALARQHLNFDCKEEEATYVYSKLWKIKKVFSGYLKDGLCVDKDKINNLDSKTLERKRLVEEEMQKGFRAAHISHDVESATNEHDLQSKSLTTLLSLQDQNYMENVHRGPYTIPENGLSGKTSGSLPMEADVISMQLDTENHRKNALGTKTAEVSFLEHWKETPNSSNDPNRTPVAGSGERQSPTRIIETTQSNGRTCEDPEIFVNEVVSDYIFMNMPSHPEQLNSAEVEAVTINSSPDTEVRQPSRAVNPLCDESTALGPKTSEVSFLEHWKESPNSSNDPHNRTPATDTWERQSPIRITETTQSDGRTCEDPEIFVDEVVADYNSMNMPSHPELINSAEVEAVTINSTPDSKVRQLSRAMNPLCDESTALEYAETTLPFVQPSHVQTLVSNSIVSYAFTSDVQLRKMAMSAIPSFSQDNSASKVMPLDMNLCQNSEDHINIHETEVILRAQDDPVEPINFSSVQSISHFPQQPSIGMPMSENAIDLLHGITTYPGYTNRDPFQTLFVTSEMPNFPSSDPLVIEMERLRKEMEEAIKIHEETILQLQSDCEKEIEKIHEKYNLSLQNANTAVALRSKELETHYNIVFLNKVLAEVLIKKIDGYKTAGSQCTEQVAIPSFTRSHISMHQTVLRSAERLEQYMAGPSLISTSLAPLVEVVNTSKTIPEIHPVGARSSPTMPFLQNFDNG